MVVHGLKSACALFVLNIMARVCHAASALGFCPGRPCGFSGVEIRYPFELPDDALGNKCYTLYPNLAFQCLDNTLYLNFTGNTTDSTYRYKVTKIDYYNQTLLLVPQGQPANCRPFEANRFGGLNITNTTTLLLDCGTNIHGSCTAFPGSNISNVCNITGAGVTDPVGRNACPMKLENYMDVAYNSCYLMETDPLIPSITGSTALELQFAGNRSTFP